jgi:predicted alpha/beta hydrolase family esterase
MAFRSELGRLAARQDQERVVVAHSLGCVLWLREAANVAPSRRVDRVVLVAPPCPGAAVEELAKFYPTGAEREAVAAAARETRLVCSDDDPYCPGDAADRYWAEPLGLVVDQLPGAAHINIEAGYGPWPEMEAWCLGDRDALVAQPAAA